MKSISRIRVTGWSLAAFATAAAASIAVAQTGTGATAPSQQDKPGAPVPSPSNTPPASDKTTPGTPDTKATPSAKPGTLKVGDAAPQWSLKDSAGNTLALKDLRGKVVLLDFWATWCGPCRMVMPELQTLHEELGDKGLVVLGMNAWEGRGKLSPDDADARAIQFKKDNKYTYRGVMRADDAAKAYGVTGIPAMFAVGPDGKLIGKWVGAGGATVQSMKAGVKSAVEDLNKAKGATDATRPSEGTGNTPDQKRGG